MSMSTKYGKAERPCITIAVKISTSEYDELKDAMKKHGDRTIASMLRSAMTMYVGKEFIHEREIKNERK